MCVRACVRACVCVRVCVCALLYILDAFIGTQAHDTKLIVGEGGEMGGREDTCEEQGCCNV